MEARKTLLENTFKLKNLSKVWWFIYLAMSIAMFVVFVFLLFYVFKSDFWIPAFFILPMMISSVVLAYASIVNITLSIRITNSSIISSHLLKTKEIAFQEVKGFRIVSTTFSDIGLLGYEIEIESKDGSIITVPKSIENQDLIIQLLKDKSFVDLG